MQNVSFSLSNTTYVSQINAKEHSRDILYLCFSYSDLWYSEVCLKAISKARKSALEMKIGQIVHHTLLFLKRLRHFEFLLYVFCYSASKSGWDAKNWISSLRDIERCMGQASKIIFDEKQAQ